MTLAKQFKIKRSKMHASNYKARPNPLAIAAIVIVVAALLGLGRIIYEPVYDFIVSLSQERTPPQVEEEPEVSEESSTPDAEPEPEPEPEPPKVMENIRAAYMPMEAARGDAALDQFLATLSPEVNTVMLDVKNDQGILSYRSKNAMAIEWEAVAADAVDLAALIPKLEQKGYAFAARLQTFSDPICARGDRENNPIKYQGSDMLWLDNFANAGGKPWANPYTPAVRQYIADLSAELGELGAVMVVLDGIRFPDDMTGSATFGSLSDGIGRSEILKTFVDEVAALLAPMGVRCAVMLPVTGVNHVSAEARYGGNPLDMAGDNVILSILPEALSTGYLAEGVSVTRPAQDPAATVREAIAYAMGFAREGQRLIPLVRGTTAGEITMTTEQIGGQIAAAAESCGEYVLYAANGAYTLP